MTDWPPPNLVHIALAHLDRNMLTSPDGENIQVSLAAICELLRNPPPMLARPRDEQMAGHDPRDDFSPENDPFKK